MCYILFFLTSVICEPLGNEGVELSFNIEVGLDGRYRFPGALYSNPVGAPNLPSEVFYIGVPQAGGVKVEVIDQESHSYNDEVKPVGRFSFEGTSFEEDRLIYSRDAFYPDFYTVTEPIVWRNMRMVILRVNPVRYNPVQRKVLVMSRFKLRLIFEQKPILAKHTDSFDNIFKNLIINYGQAQDWRLERYSLELRSVFDMPFWYKIPIDSEGIYKIDYDLMKKLAVDPGRIDPRTIRLYTAGFDTLGGDVIDTMLFNGLVEVPIMVYGEEDGRFDRGDYILFYALGANYLKVKSDSLMPVSYFNNPFDRLNFYWLTYGGKPGRRFERVDGRPGGGMALEYIMVPVHYEEEHENFARSGLRWAWQTMTLTEHGSWSFPVEHIGASGRGEVGTKIISMGRNFRIQLYYNDSLFCDTVWQHWDFNVRKPVDFYGDSGILRIDLSVVGRDTFSLYLDWFELNYPAITKLDHPLYSLITIPGEYRYEISGVRSPPVVLDITDPRLPRLIYNLEVSGDSLRFSHRVDSISFLYCSDLDKARQPKLEPVRFGNLRQNNTGCDYLILTSDEFYDEMRPLYEWRRRGYRCRMVKLSEVYNNFGFGKEEPAAIKYFLYYVYRNWQPMPKYVVYVGDGSHDYKNNLNLATPNRFFPVFERGENLIDPQGNLCYDDWFVEFNRMPTMIVGRLNVRTKRQARVTVKKVLDYEQNKYLGPWAKKIIMVGDDEWSPYGLEWHGFWMHAPDCESTLRFVPDSIADVTKIYMNVYRNEGGKKPKSRLDFLEAMNQGALCGAFYGHGNNHQLAHEGVFYGDDVNLVNNGRRNFFFYYGTCSAGRFDDSKYESLCEEFVVRENGAIATYGATRGTAPEENVPLGNQIFNNIFNQDLTIGECCYNAKQTARASVTYCLFGDPAVRLKRPSGGVTVAAVPETLRPLGRGLLRCSEPKFFMTASVRDSLSGLIHYVVRDQSDSIIDTFNFHVQGQPFFHGVASKESLNFVAPRVSTLHQPVLRFSVYNDGNATRLDSVPLRGLATPSGDVQPPRIEFFAGGRKLQNGDWVEKNLSLTGVIEDESGLNLLDPPDNEQQGFGLYVNQNKTEVTDLRNHFSYDLDSYQRGRFAVELTLPDKEDTITVYVSDNNYNRAEVKIGLKVAISDQLVIENFLIYPNPVKRDGYFTFDLSVGAVVDIVIYTVAGRLVRRLENKPARAGYNQVYWDGLDHKGEKIANGVYLVKLQARRHQAEGEESVSKIERFIVAHDKE